MDEKFLKPYDPKATEEIIYEKWESSGFFNPDNLPDRHLEPFSSVLPPPNVTGTLHIGHALMLAIQDITIRFERMRGKKTLWLPGTDHAAIATQSRVEEEIYKKEEKTRYDLGREELLKRIDTFASESHDVIVSQIKRMGSSLDWSRESYTLDEKRNLAVRTAFKKMFDDGLIYRGQRIVNWDPKMQTTVSDEEIEYKEEKTNLYYLKYGPFTIATARPETKFGDKYVVMNPNDTRYQEYQHGQKLQLEWINGLITATVIKDLSIDMEFGTGVMTITPAHSAIDFEIAKRHELEIEQIIDEKGKLLPIAGDLSGVHIKKARPQIVEKLQKKGLLEKIEENYIHNIAINSRGGGIIEPQIKLQWFVDVNQQFTIPHSNIPFILSGSKISLKELMRKSVESKAISILPERFEKIYYHWVDNLRDWCISRQIWYGHRIPVWYREEEAYCGINPPQGDGWTQDEDTLDTWFSSGLWTFSTLGWPEETADLKEFHPTNFLETGYDILFFWVARMILMSGYLLGEVPFKTVYLHGLVRDGQGRKISKSLGNNIDPVQFIEKYGADAVRMALIIGTAPGSDSKISEDKVRAYKYFTNKIWNIARFILQNTEGEKLEDGFSNPNEFDETFRAERKTILEDITDDMENFRFYLAAEKLYHYTWHTLADKIIEESKVILESGSPAEKARRKQFLIHTLDKILRALHPFMPFITEEIWQSLPQKENNTLLMIEEWPISSDNSK